MSTAVAATLFATVAADNASLLVAQLQLVDLDNRTRGRRQTWRSYPSKSSVRGASTKQALTRDVRFSQRWFAAMVAMVSCEVGHEVHQVRRIHLSTP
jgi:hypothetical protein